MAWGLARSPAYRSKSISTSKLPSLAEQYISLSFELLTSQVRSPKSASVIS